jgi:ferric-dicitrate binding protein FerR (iron transport regulator)
MMDVEQEAGSVSARARDAAEWFVENESDRELDEETVLQWEEWCTHAWNNAAYVGITQIWRQLPLLPAPTFGTGEDLLRDALAEGAPES